MCDQREKLTFCYYEDQQIELHVQKICGFVLSSKVDSYHAYCELEKKVHEQLREVQKNDSESASNRRVKVLNRIDEEEVLPKKLWIGIFGYYQKGILGELRDLTADKGEVHFLIKKMKDVANTVDDAKACVRVLCKLSCFNEKDIIECGGVEYLSYLNTFLKKSDQVSLDDIFDDIFSEE